MAYGVISEEELNIFNKPARLLISGFSGSEKISFVRSLIKIYRDCFQRVIVLSSDLENSTELDVEFDSEFNPFQEFLKGNTLYILDDVIYNENLLTLAGEAFIRERHLNVS